MLLINVFISSLFLCLLIFNSSLSLNSRIIKKFGQQIIAYTLISPLISHATENTRPLSECFNIIRNEIKSSESLNRLNQDITNENWKDILSFTKEYEAGFRGGILKPAWKQLSGNLQEKGITLTNSFTYDLIGLNKAARIKDLPRANEMIANIKKDLVDFVKLDEQTLN